MNVAVSVWISLGVHFQLTVPRVAKSNVGYHLKIVRFMLLVNVIWGVVLTTADSVPPLQSSYSILVGATINSRWIITLRSENSFQVSFLPLCKQTYAVSTVWHFWKPVIIKINVWCSIQPLRQKGMVSRYSCLTDSAQPPLYANIIFRRRRTGVLRLKQRAEVSGARPRPRTEVSRHMAQKSEQGNGKDFGFKVKDRSLKFKAMNLHSWYWTLNLSLHWDRFSVEHHTAAKWPIKSH